MLQRLRTRASDEKGFTLIELLVVILIIGILAAIALPTFLGQQKKGQDSSAKSDARNLVSHVESCFADSQDYQTCVTPAQLGTTGLNFVVGPPPTAQGEVTVTSTAPTSYVVTALSKSGNTFRITKTLGAGPTRDCTSSDATYPNGGCKNAGAGGW